MSKNRVEELESTVAELEATVQGLTEELVESKERIRTLEAALNGDEDVAVQQRSDRRRGPDREAEPDDVAAAAAQAEEDKTEAGETTDNDGEESGLDDIIVA